MAVLVSVRTFAMSGARYDRRDDRYRDDGRARRDDRGGGHRDRRDDDRRDPAPRRDRSRSRDRRPPIPHRSRSPTPDRRLQRRRPTLFDVPPDGEIGVQMPGGGVGVPPGLRGLSSATDHSQIGLPPGMGLVGGVQTGGVPPGPPGVGAAPQATRHARRLYVGSLPPSANEFSTSTFFNQALRAVSGAVENTPGDPVLNAYFNVEKRFAFVEFRSIIETSNALGLDGVVMDGQAIRIRRPNDYNAAAAAALGPSLPSQSLNLAMVGMAGVVGAAGGATNTTAPVSAEDQANRLFIGGLPYFLTDQMVKELVEAFGVTKSFKLVIDPETGNSKGYGFFVYQDPSVTDVACQGLHGMKMGEKTLTVKRAGESKGAASQGTAAPQAPAGYGYAVPGGDGKGLSCFTTFRLPDCPYETDIYFYNLRRAAPKPAAAAAAAGGFGNTVARPPVQPAVARRVPVRYVRNRRAPG